MTTLRCEIPEKMLPFAAERRRHKIARGGRGGGKSWAVARLLAVRGYAEPIRWLCCREIQRSIKESSLRTLADQIRALGLSNHYEIQQNIIRGRNGTEFIFAGLRDHTADSIKSYEGCDGAWIEEAHSVSERSANVLIPTIRKNGSEIWWTYNPDTESDYVHKLAESNDDNVLVVTINWRDNQWFPDVLQIERERLRAVNDDLYQHVWEGKCRTAAGVLFKRRWFKQYQPSELPRSMNYYIGCDYAGGRDPDNPEREPDKTELGVWGIDTHGDLWAVDWWTGEGEEPETWAPMLAEMVRKYKARAVFEEKGIILRTVQGVIDRALQSRKAWTQRIGIASAGGKIDRALGFAMLASSGKVHIPATAWGDRLIEQLCSFTGQDGRTDDMVDVCSIIARGIDQMQDARPAAEPERKILVPFTEAWFAARDHEDDDSRRKAEGYYR